MVTIKDVAKKAGVSIATVSRVSNNVPGVSYRTRQRVLEAIRELTYQPNRVAQGLVKNRTGMVSLVLPEIRNPFFSDLINSVYAELSLSDLGMSFALFTGNVESDRRMLRRIASANPDGVIMLPFEDPSNYIEALCQELLPDKPIVMIDVLCEDHPSVATDHCRGGALVANHFLDLGHRSFSLICPHECPKTRGFVSALVDAGIPLESIRRVTFSPAPGVKEVENMRRAARAAIEPEPRPTALFLISDYMAVYVLSEIRAMGLTVPQDIAVASYDDTVISLSTSPRLTSVAQPLAEMGRWATQMLTEAIESGTVAQPPRQVLLEPRLIVRESTVVAKSVR